MPLSTRPLLTFTFATAFALAGCGAGIDEATRSSGGGSSDAMVRLVNVADDRPSLDLYATNTVVQSGVVLNTTGAYGSVASGSASLNVRAPGDPTQLATVTPTLAKGEHRGVVAATTDATFMATLLSEDEGSPDRGKAKLRVLNLAGVQAGPLDLFIAASCSNLPSTTTPTVASGTSGYVQVTSPSTVTRLCVTKVGDHTDLRLDGGAVTLSDQRIVTVILVRAAATGKLVKGFTLDQQGALLALAP